MAQKKLFEEYDYDKRKGCLPEGYEPLEYINNICRHRDIKYIHVGWYKSEKEVLARIDSLHNVIPYIKFSIDKRLASPIAYKYGFFAPDIIYPYLLEGEDVTAAVKRNQYNIIPEFLYRQIKNDSKNGIKYVEEALNNGSLLISSFNKFKKLENERRDIYEQRNIVDIYNSNGKTIELDIEFDFDCLVLCTSLPSFCDFQNKNEWIQINNVSEFIDELTSTLTKSGVEISEVLLGSCVYSDKRLSKQNDELVDCFTKYSEKIPFGELVKYINYSLADDILMNKPTDFIHEKEFRIVFKLSKKIEQSKLSGNVAKIKDGIIINDKSLTKYFKKVN